MAEVGALISLAGVAAHPDCWSVCLCYLHFAPENPKMVNKDTIFGYHTEGTHRCPHKEEEGKHRQNAA